MDNQSSFGDFKFKPLTDKEKVAIKEKRIMQDEWMKREVWLKEVKERSKRLEVWLDKGMSIDRQKTFDEKGYWVEDLPPGSNKKVWAVCIQCAKGRWLPYRLYRDMCHPCAVIEKESGENHYLYGKHHSDEAKCKMADAAKKRTGERGSNWQGGLSFGKYCSKFNDSLKERIREKYGRKCIICNMTEEENGRKLDVHHVDYNKNCGCDGNECRLVPLCTVCHRRTNGKRSHWEELIMQKIVELFPDINFDNPHTTLSDFCILPDES